jgi:hypothetical protein
MHSSSNEFSIINSPILVNISLAEENIQVELSNLGKPIGNDVNTSNACFLRTKIYEID